MVGVVPVAALGSAGLLVVAGAVWWATRAGWVPSDLGFGSETAFPTLSSAAKPTGLRRVFTTVDHRDVGAMYLVFAVVAMLWGGTDALMLRTELVTPAATVWEPTTYDQLFTTHAFTMLFFFVTPAFTGLANYLLPPLIGADDVAFPRVNAVAFWLLPPALLLVRAGLVTDVLGTVLRAVGASGSAFLALAPPATGWTMYVPLALRSGNPQFDLTLLGLHLSGVATTTAAINLVVTVVTERADDVPWDGLDIFSWAMLTTSGLVLFAFPVLGSTLVMLLLDRNVGTTFFTVGGGGPLLYQHLFWFFGHPEVYIVVLPAFGLTSLLLPKFAGRRLFGFTFVVYSTLAIGVLSFGVWAHHMFATGIDPRLQASFMAVSVAIAVPSAVKVFNWITTLWNGRVRLTAPMLCLLGGVATFVVGGVTGVFLAAVPVDRTLHGTYYVVGHFHLVLVGVVVLSLFAASYYWYPLFVGRMYDRRLARVQAVVVALGVPLTFLPMLALGVAGLPRRYAAYPPQFAVAQQVSTAGAFLLGAGVVLWFWNVVQSARVGDPVTDADVWDLKASGQFTREWQWFERRLREREDS
ncbi:MAG: cbb3-type cytochrome c oxidase subunit I [Halobacteriaceae archaeon]